jgi:hypothetical protein
MDLDQTDYIVFAIGTLAITVCGLVWFRALDRPKEKGRPKPPLRLNAEPGEGHLDHCTKRIREQVQIVMQI